MHKMKTLKNGLKLITVPVAGTKTATILVMIGTGSKYETKENNGISHFLEHMFFKGTAKRPTTLTISSELDAIGGEYNAFTAHEYTGYYAKVDASKIKVAIDVISDMLINSKFDAQEIEKEKGVIIEEINMYEDNPMAHMEDVFEECLYGDQPAGWEIIGTKENINCFKRDDFVDYLKTQYGAKNSLVCIAGKINAQAIKAVEKYFAGLSLSKPKKKLAVIEKQTQPAMLLKHKKTDQAHLSLGVRTYKIGHKDEAALKVLSVLLGGSMSSRLFISLREQKGLAYYIRTNAEFYTDVGYLTAQAGVPLEKIDEAIKTIIDEYNNIKKEKITEEELKRVKDYIKGKVVINMEASDVNATWFGRQMILRGKIVTVEEYLKKINKVTAKDLARVANDVFVNKGLNLAVIGPYEDKSRFEKLLSF